jgi:D-lactate dehydrogenase
MKVVAYSILDPEKEFLAKANQKKHHITLISNSLSMETAGYAEGKDAVVVYIHDDVSAQVVHRLADMGIKYIATRSADTNHIDKEAAAARGIILGHIPVFSLPTEKELLLLSPFAIQEMADYTIRNLDRWQKEK